MVIASNIMIVFSMIMMTCGMIGLIRSKSFYRRLINIALVDTIGVLSLLLGLIIRQSSWQIAGKLLFLGLIIFLIAPVISHKLGRSAYISLHRGGVKEIHE